MEALTDTPVVLITGPRRVGKTTLVRRLAGARYRYITLDDTTVLASARSDPTGFIRGLDYAVIDEIQRAPELLLALKKSIDEDYRPGRFLLTGSANLLTLPRVSESLAGRMEILPMLPLSQAELESVFSNFLERLFAAQYSTSEYPVHGADLLTRVLAGGFPEALARPSERRRQDWALSYLDSVLTSDLRDIADIEKITELPRFVRFLAEHSAQLVNYASFGASIDISQKTSKRYVGLLEQIFLIASLPPYHAKHVTRLVKSPKLHFLDTGLLAAVSGITAKLLTTQRNRFGPLLESFAYAEIMKLISTSGMRLTPLHFRDQEGREVDIVLERNDGMLAGIEVKVSATVRASDFNGLRAFARVCGERFSCGVILYDGDTCVPFFDRYAAVPFSALWSAG